MKTANAVKVYLMRERYGWTAFREDQLKDKAVLMRKKEEASKVYSLTVTCEKNRTGPKDPTPEFLEALTTALVDIEVEEVQ
jgi:hypothetical protein